MSLRSLSYHQELSPKQYFHLFQDLAKQPVRFDYGMEIIDAALDGRINFNKEFNLMGYAHAIEENVKKNQSTKAKKVVHFVDSDDENENGITIDSIASEYDAYDDFIEDKNLKYTVDKVKSLEHELLCECGVDILFVIRKALESTPEAIETLKEVCEMCPKFSEYMEVILSSGVPFEELFPEDKIADKNKMVSTVSETVEDEMVLELAVISADEELELSVAVSETGESETSDKIVSIHARADHCSISGKPELKMVMGYNGSKYLIDSC